jgi:hypothetical protein
MTARYSVAIGAAVVAVLLSPTNVVGQQNRTPNGAPAKAAYAQPRTPDGQPDIRGFWRSVPFGTYSLEDLSLQGLGGGDFFTKIPGGSRIVDPPDGKIPYKPWAAAKAKDIYDHHMDPKPYQLDPQARCWLQGVPRGTVQSESHVVQTPGQIVILHEYSHSYRVIPLDDRPKLPEHMKLFMGESRGRWEGNTLVIDTTNLNDIPWFDIVGSFHSDATHVTERITRIDDETLEYLATVEDAKMYTRPWTIRFTLKRNTEPGYEQWEHACYEGDRSLDRLLTRPDDRR